MSSLGRISSVTANVMRELMSKGSDPAEIIKYIHTEVGIQEDILLGCIAEIKLEIDAMAKASEKKEEKEEEPVK